MPFCGGTTRSIDRDQVVGTERRPELELPQYGGGQEKQRPATVREKETPPGRHPIEGTVTVVGWKVCRNKERGDGVSPTIVGGHQAKPCWWPLEALPLLPSVWLREAEAAGGWGPELGLWETWLSQTVQVISSWRCWLMHHFYEKHWSACTHPFPPLSLAHHVPEFRRCWLADASQLPCTQVERSATLTSRFTALPSVPRGASPWRVWLEPCFRN